MKTNKVREDFQKWFDQKANLEQKLVQVEDKRLVTSNTHDKKTAERQQHE
jgi:hypothetical protein